MLLKKMIPFKIDQGNPVGDIAEAVGQRRFEPTLPQQLKTAGFAPVIPGDPNGSLVEDIGDFKLIRFMIEERKVSPSQIREEAEERERQRGGRLSRQERATLRDQVLLEFLPKVLPKRDSFLVAIGKGYLIAFGTTANRAESVLKTLWELMPGGLRVVPALPSTQSYLTQWLSDPNRLPDGFDLGRIAEFAGKAGGEKAALRNMDLPSEESEKLLAMPSIVTKLGMVSPKLHFELNDKGVVSGMKATDMLDIQMNESMDDAEGQRLSMLAVLNIEIEAIAELVDLLREMMPGQ